MIDAREAVRALQTQIARVKGDRDTPVRIEMHATAYRLIMVYLGSDPSKTRLTKLFGVPVVVTEKVSPEWVVVVATVKGERQ